MIQHYRITPAGPWQSPLTDDRIVDCRAAALLLAARCTDAGLVREANRLCHVQTQFPNALHWDPTSIAQGDLGQALLCAELARLYPDDDWSTKARTWAASPVQLLRRGRRPGMGTVSGSSGVAFVGRRLGQPVLDELPVLDGVIARDALTTAATIRGRHGLSVSTFDQISGLAGVLLCALPNDQQSTRPVTPFVVRALVALALEQEGSVPAWYTPPEYLFDEDQRMYYPFGNLNLGLAHGIPGPLAALALTLRAGLGDRSAIEGTTRLAEWMAAHVTLGPEGPGWNTVVELVQGPAGLVERPAHGVGRDAWCYGTPGAARALFLAGLALDRSDLCNLAIESMAAVYRRTPDQRGVDSPTFCHGVAGLLQITLRFHHDTQLPLFADAATALTGQLLNAIEPDRPMGIANLEPGDNKVDQPGVLDGAAGVALVLLGAASEVEPTWDRMFALS